MNIKKANVGHFFISILFIFTLASCTATSFSQSSNQDDYLHKIDFLSAQSSALLNNATIGQTVIMTDRVIPSNAEVTILDSYDSAAGRRCLNAMVETPQQRVPMLFCQYSNQQWGASRALPKTLVQ